ncbi:hypothetical protein FQN49_001354 [Arthroderma sp. PD_2]|nr:hypothetical protein FQN49_001354 [Arthroderma sp. PD_2]
MRSELPDLSFPELNFLSSHSRSRHESPRVVDIKKRTSLSPYEQNTISKYFSPSRTAKPRHVDNPLKAHGDGPSNLRKDEEEPTLFSIESNEHPSSYGRALDGGSCQLRQRSAQRPQPETRGSIADPDQSTTYYTWSGTNSVIQTRELEDLPRTVDPEDMNKVRRGSNRPNSASSSRMDSMVQSMLFRNAYIPSPKGLELGRHVCKPRKTYSLEDLFQKARETSLPITNTSPPYRTTYTGASGELYKRNDTSQHHRGPIPKEPIIQEPSWRQTYLACEYAKGRTQLSPSPSIKSRVAGRPAKWRAAGCQFSIGQKLSCSPDAKGTRELAVYPSQNCPSDNPRSSRPRTQHFLAEHTPSFVKRAEGRDSPLQAYGHQTQQPSQNFKPTCLEECGQPYRRPPTLHLSNQRASSTGVPTFNCQYRLYGSPPHFNLPNEPQSEFVDLEFEYTQGEVSNQQLHALDDDMQTLQTPSEHDRNTLSTPQKLDTPSPLEPKALRCPVVTELNVDPLQFWRPNKLY